MNAGKPPAAIRITRPYQTEDEFLAHELDTISRTGVTLVGAQQRPEGIVLRFELALASGAPLLRGEGRVVGYKATALGNEPGLSLRFTRLDSKSKALVDRVGSMREVRRSIPPPPAASSPVVPVPTASSEPMLAVAPEPLASSDAIPISVDLAQTAEAPVERTVKKATDRDALLARLRQRSVDIATIVAEGSARRKRAR